jgi:flagellar biosynthesis protein FlhA
VKGDAIAALLILGVNIIAGFCLGMIEPRAVGGRCGADLYRPGHRRCAGRAVPSLLLSIAAAVIVTRVNSEHDLSGQIASQFGSAKAWTPVAAILGLLGVLPGMPHMIILPPPLARASLPGACGNPPNRPPPHLRPPRNRKTPQILSGTMCPKAQCSASKSAMASSA